VQTLNLKANIHIVPFQSVKNSYFKFLWGSVVVTLFRGSWKILPYFLANLSNTLHINYYQNQSSIVKVMTKKIGCFLCPTMYFCLIYCLWCSVIVALPLPEFTLFILMNVRQALHGCQPLDQASQPQPQIHLNWQPLITTKPKSWYSFYHPVEGRRLSRPGWLVTYDWLFCSFTQWHTSNVTNTESY